MKNHVGLNTLIMIDMYLDIHEQFLVKTNFFAFKYTEYILTH